MKYKQNCETCVYLSEVPEQTLSNGLKAPFVATFRISPEKFPEFPPIIRVISSHKVKFLPPEEEVSKQIYSINFWIQITFNKQNLLLWEKTNFAAILT